MEQDVKIEKPSVIIPNTWFVAVLNGEIYKILWKSSSELEVYSKKTVDLEKSLGSAIKINVIVGGRDD